MRLTSFTDYGLRTLLHMAGAPGQPFSTAHLAREFGISRNHLAKVFTALAAAGLIETRRGTGGGAVLSRPPDQILLGEVVRALESGQPLVECFAQVSHCTLMPGCRLRSRLSRAKEAFLAELDRSSLADCVLEPAAD